MCPSLLLLSLASDRTLLYTFEKSSAASSLVHVEPNFRRVFPSARRAQIKSSSPLTSSFKRTFRCLDYIHFWQIHWGQYVSIGGAKPHRSPGASFLQALTATVVSPLTQLGPSFAISFCYNLKECGKTAVTDIKKFIHVSTVSNVSSFES